MLKVIVCTCLLMAASSTATAIGQADMDDLKNRVDRAKSNPALKNNQCIDIKVFSGDWRTNPARATLKYGKPNGYCGKLKRIFIRNGSDADLVFDAGDGNETIAYLFPYQAGPWTKNNNGKWKPAGGLTTMEFAAQYDIGQEFLLLCNRTLPNQLVDCLAFTPEVTK